MSNNQLNLITGIALVMALVGCVIVQGISLLLHGVLDDKITGVIVTLIGLLQAYRHLNDVKLGNGSSGMTPDK